jgi:hypothetical protein
MFKIQHIFESINKSKPWLENNPAKAFWYLIHVDSVLNVGFHFYGKGGMEQIIRSKLWRTNKDDLLTNNITLNIIQNDYDRYKKMLKLAISEVSSYCKNNTFINHPYPLSVYEKHRDTFKENVRYYALYYKDKLDYNDWNVLLNDPASPFYEGNCVFYKMNNDTNLSWSNGHIDCIKLPKGWQGTKLSDFPDRLQISLIDFFGDKEVLKMMYETSNSISVDLYTQEDKSLVDGIIRTNYPQLTYDGYNRRNTNSKMKLFYKPMVLQKKIIPTTINIPQDAHSSYVDASVQVAHRLLRTEKYKDVGREFIDRFHTIAV